VKILHIMAFIDSQIKTGLKVECSLQKLFWIKVWPIMQRMTVLVQWALTEQGHHTTLKERKRRIAKQIKEDKSKNKTKKSCNCYVCIPYVE